MAQVSFSLPEKAWAGLNTRFRQESNYIDDDQFTAGTYNVLTDFTGAIVKVPGGQLYSSLSHTNSDQYEAVFSSGVRHLLEVENGTLKYSSGDGTFHTVTSGYTATANFEFALYNNRVYFGNGVDDPQSYDLVTSYGGVTYSTPKTKKQGALVPTIAPTFNADSSSGSVPIGSHTYLTTFLYYDSTESNGGPASSLHTVSSPNQTVNLTTVQVGGYGVTARKIYRDDNDGNYVLIGVIHDNTTTTFADTIALGTTPVPLDNGLPPKYSLIVEHLDRLWVAGVAGNTSTLYWSVAGLPDLFSAFGFLTCNPTDPITALYKYNDRVMVFNKHSTGQILNRDEADFRYSELTPNVGCIDNRSIQVRTIRGLPTIIWLSEFGWYEFNGSSITAISSEIDDQVQFNLQQGTTTRGSHTDTNQSDFTAGTASPGIDLTSIPGSVTTKVPVKEWSTESDWEGGSSLVNVGTHSGLPEMTVPVAFTPTLVSGTLTGAAKLGALVGGFTHPPTITIQTIPDRTGESASAGSNFSTNTPGPHIIDALAQKFLIPYAGTLTNVQFQFDYDSANPSDFATVTVWQDNFGIPGTVLYSSTIATGNGTRTTVSVNKSLSLFLAAGTYWYGVNLSTVSGINIVSAKTELTSQFNNGHNFIPLTACTFAQLQVAKLGQGATAWQQVYSGSTALNQLDGSYTFVQTPIAASGQWTSSISDSQSDSIASGLSINIAPSVSYPASTSCAVVLQGSNDIVTPTWVTTDSQVNPSAGGVSFAGSGYRWWRIIYIVSTSDTRVVPYLCTPTLNFNTTATWISNAIETTLDCTSLDQLVTTSVIPVGTSITTTIATSSDNVTYSPYTVLGSATPSRYAKVKVVMVATGDDLTSPVVTDVLLTWSLTSNLVSAPIDTGAVPAGWDIFTDAELDNDGTVTFYLRSATTSGGLTAQSFVLVTNGSFPTIPVNKWVQWKVVITNSTVNLAQVQAVTINWFSTSGNSIRAASLFYKKRYYMAAAEFSQPCNNVVYVYDEFNTWKIIRNVSAATLGLFFNNPYYGDAGTGRIVKWLVGNTNVGGVNIPLDVRTKSFSKLPSNDIGVGADEAMIRWIRSLVIKAVGTGARLTPTFSPDGGITFLAMSLIETGNPYVDLPSDGALHAFRFVPIAEDVSTTRSIMVRVTNNDAFPVSITNMKITCMTSKREVFNG